MAQAATVCGAGCNRRWRRLQLQVAQAAAVSGGTRLQPSHTRVAEAPARRRRPSSPPRSARRMRPSRGGCGNRRWTRWTPRRQPPRGPWLGLGAKVGAGAGLGSGLGLGLGLNEVGKKDSKIRWASNARYSRGEYQELLRRTCYVLLTSCSSLLPCAPTYLEEGRRHL